MVFARAVCRSSCAGQVKEQSKLAGRLRVKHGREYTCLAEVKVVWREMCASMWPSAQTGDGAIERQLRGTRGFGTSSSQGCPWGCAGTKVDTLLLSRGPHVIPSPPLPIAVLLVALALSACAMARKRERGR